MQYQGKERKALMGSPFDLTGRVALVTGGGTGIGKAIALGLAEAGANLVLCGRRLEKCEEACGEVGDKTKVRTLACRCDTTKKSEVDSLVETAIEAFGRIDILVNNAGVTSTFHVLDLPEEEWDRVIDTNLKGYFLCSQAAGRLMAQAKRGVILNVGSQLGDVARPNKAHYLSSKGGIKMLTKALSVDLAPYGIRVNCIAPGPVETEMAAPVLSEPALRNQFLSHVPLGRLGQSKDIAGAAVYLASDAASWVTGTTLYVEGGYLAI
jgi:NAD(P)-dependent dehydrogenase (short-subunit alcohol dehydrogenase family)